MISITLQSVFAAALALLFFSTGLHKLRASAKFQAQLAEYRLLPNFSVAPFGYLLAVVELGLVPGLLLPATRSYAGAVAAGLLTVYAVAIAINLARGRANIDCGCGDAPQMLSPWLLLRNMILSLTAATMLLPVSNTAFQWTELWIAFPTFVAICLVYLVVEQLLENASVLREWNELQD